VPILLTVRILIEELWVVPMEDGQRKALVEQPTRIAADR